ncbi:macro domain-containing protein [Cytobacillus sp. FJAT-54145]|uniref:Macro domain-containing protein n=1 Tax=Cytobacillus spartinae TaxID=3299023 RepID=A0ABW6KE81_9BACI
MKYTEQKQDLFTVSRDYTLAHCISTDCKMGAGIAKTFRDLYPKIPKVLLALYPKIGQAVCYRTSSGQRIYHLITKRLYWEKPTYESLRATLLDLKKQMVNRGEGKLAIPQIGCGLDRLEWNQVSIMIQDIFQDTDIDILVCRLK